MRNKDCDGKKKRLLCIFYKTISMSMTVDTEND